ncbi:uncharacterized protein G2W53_001426 [Senna tora]|uniref:Uncharacterized protein n=1 Tax=Senna tora TaxID=362788 RepID=A0A834XIQ1_9FABA|nr:uncharacterized protein G2W53_001426 [Senna tora]
MAETMTVPLSLSRSDLTLLPLVTQEIYEVKMEIS